MENDYTKIRLEPQMAYYKKKCAVLQKEYYTLSVISIIVNATIPIFAIAIESISAIKYVVAGLSAIATISSSILLLKKTKDTWVEYRFTYEMLKREKIMFECGAGNYTTKDVKCFISNCERIMNSEHSTWTQLMKEQKNK